VILNGKVLVAYLDGKSYQEIALSVNRHVKSHRQCLQRVRAKAWEIV